MPAPYRVVRLRGGVDRSTDLAALCALRRTAAGVTVRPMLRYLRAAAWNTEALRYVDADPAGAAAECARRIAAAPNVKSVAA